MNSNDDIEKGLFEALENASMDAPGTDWNAFEKRRNKRKRRAVLWIFFTGLLLLTGVVSSLFLLQDMPSSRSERKVITSTKGSMENKQEKLQENDAPASVEAKPGISGKNEAEPLAKLNIYNRKTQVVVRNPVEDAREPADLQVNPAFETSLSTDLTETIRNPEQEISPDIELSPIGIRKFKYAFSTSEYLLKPAKPLKVKKIKLSSFFVQFQAGPELNFPGFKVSEAGKAFIHKDYAGIRKSSESGLAGYGFQLTGGLHHKKLDVSFGLGLSSTMVYGHYDFVYFEKPLINTDGTVAGYNSTTPTTIRYNSKQNYTFVEFPLYLDYALFGKNKIKTSLHLGMVNQFLKNIGGELPNALFMDHKDQLSPENFKTYSANAEIGLRIAYLRGKRIQYAITPVYRKNFGFSQVQSYYKNSFNSLGIQFSIRTRL